MPDRVFIDSNIIIYAYSVDEPKKQVAVNTLLGAHEMILISTQTINEFVTVTTRKKILRYGQASAAVKELFAVFSVETIDQNSIQNAITLAEKYHYSYFDSLMIASALMSHCSILYSEDMHHQQLIENKLKIINPFHNESGSDVS
jgi:predicted nucleic acid-binding protein